MKSPPNAVSLLLTNLQLLDYDNGSEESFPITPDVFTSLKNKGKAFEHIVYHLLHILDPEECALRFDACWPVFEPAQSRELRNIVFKWLTDLKKNGQLGGNILIRRTLLEDCSGDRYEELLLSLSTMVLRDQIEKGNFQDANRKTFAYKQTSSLAPSPKALIALILAHQSSLARLLHSRRLSKSQWSSFATFLDSKELQISTISESLSHATTDGAPKILPRGYEDEVLRKWRDNWLGDQRWLDILLKGDPEYMRDQFFELPFQKALDKHHHFKNGLAGVRDGDVSLLALEKQVQEQKNRLRELRQMREEALKAIPRLDSTISPNRAKDRTDSQTEKKDLRVVFNQHQRLHSGQVRIANDYMANQRNEYTELMDSLREDLAAAGVPMRREVTVPPEYRFQPAPSKPVIQAEVSGFKGEDVDSDEEMLDSELLVSEYSRYGNESDHDIEMSESPLQGQYNHPDSPLIKVSQQIEEYGPQPTASSDASYQGGDDEEKFSNFQESIIISDFPSSHVDPISPLPPSQGRSRMRDSLGLGDDELLAEQIVSTMAATNFSPEKPSPTKRNQPRYSYKPPVLDDIFDMDESGLRLSICQPQNTQHQQDEQSSFPYAPRDSLSTPIRDPVASPTRKEDLLLSSDYNSVFKSRPKIAVSPTLTPVGGSPLPNLSLMSGVSMTPGAVFSEDEVANLAAEHASSPLVKKNVRRGKMQG